MDCHRCIHIKYDGCRYGRCASGRHPDVVIKKTAEGDKRSYNKMICPDFVLRKRCSNCFYWKRGKYFSDGKTPAEKGRCSLRCQERHEDCPIWRPGSTSSRKYKQKVGV